MPAAFLIVIFAFAPRLSVGQQSAKAFAQSAPPHALSVFTAEDIHLDEEPVRITKNRIVIVKSFDDPEIELCSIKPGDTIQALSGEFKESQKEEGAIYFRGTVQRQISDNCVKNLLDLSSAQGGKASSAPADTPFCRWIPPECERRPQKIEIVFSDHITPFFYDFSKGNETTFVPPWLKGDKITLMDRETYNLWFNNRLNVFLTGSDIDGGIISSDRTPFTVFLENFKEEYSPCAIKTGERVKISHGDIRYEGAFWEKELVFVGQVERADKLRRCRRHFPQTVKIILPKRLTDDFFGFSRWNPLQNHTLLVNPPETLFY